MNRSGRWIRQEWWEVGREASGVLTYPSMETLVTTSRGKIRPTFPVQQEARPDYRTMKTFFLSVCACVFVLDKQVLGRLIPLTFLQDIAITQSTQCSLKCLSAHRIKQKKSVIIFSFLCE